MSWKRLSNSLLYRDIYTGNERRKLHQSDPTADYLEAFFFFVSFFLYLSSMALTFSGPMRT